MKVLFSLGYDPGFSLTLFGILIWEDNFLSVERRSEEKAAPDHLSFECRQ